jgi:hypothetical protein
MILFPRALHGERGAAGAAGAGQQARPAPRASAQRERVTKNAPWVPFKHFPLQYQSERAQQRDSDGVRCCTDFLSDVSFSETLRHRSERAQRDSDDARCCTDYLLSDV